MDVADLRRKLLEAAAANADVSADPSAAGTPDEAADFALKHAQAARELTAALETAQGLADIEA